MNIANVGRKPYLPLHAFLIQEMLQIGFQMRGEIIWNKGTSAGPSTAWGSWKSAANPSLRDVHEYILVFSKGSFSRDGRALRTTITRDEFLELTKSVWTFPAESARRIGHPAPFPVELPRRLIELYSFKGDVVLDPFAGSGSTCLAAIRSGRTFVAYEKNLEYVRLAKGRISIESGRKDKLLTLRVESMPGGVRISVIDNGVGIAPENMGRLFTHGFTTRQSGHGFGLHSGALAAQELGGTLRAESEGPGLGATFILELPTTPRDAAHV